MSGPTKAWLFLSLLAAAILYTGHSWGGRQGVLWALLVALGVNTLIYFYSEVRILSLFPGRKLEGRDPWGALEITKSLCKKMRLPLPQILVLQDSSPQALALGRSWNHSTIVLTQGLLDRFSRRELKAILAYQLASIRRQETFAFAVAAAFADAILSVARSLDKVSRLLLGTQKDPRSKNPGHFFSWLLSPLAAGLLRFSVGPGNYYAIDALASEICEDPKAVAEVLWKLESFAKTIPLLAPASQAHMFMVNPLTKRGWSRYFHVQPETKRRIERLVGYYPI